MYHTGISYEEIERRTIPQIMAILKGAGENISIKMGLPFSSALATEEIPKEMDNDAKLAQINQFVKTFNN